MSAVFDGRLVVENDGATRCWPDLCADLWFRSGPLVGGTGHDMVGTEWLVLNFSSFFFLDVWHTLVVGLHHSVGTWISGDEGSSLRSTTGRG